MAQDLTKGRPFFIILKFALPVIGGNLFQLFYTLADSVIVGRTLWAPRELSFIWCSVSSRGSPEDLEYVLDTNAGER